MKDHLKVKRIEEWELYKGKPLTICGPCSAESYEQLMGTAKELAKEGRTNIFRAGIWKPRTRPNSFEGVGREGLSWLREVKRETGLPVATEVANSAHVNDALKFGVDVLWLGARTSANPFAVQEIADSLQGVEVTVLIKNPINPDLNLWIGSIERIARAGVVNIAAIHRGFSTYEHTLYRNQPKWLVPIELKRAIPQLPILCDPSHMGGSKSLLHDISQKAMDLNYDGLMIESHIEPSRALSDKDQQLTPTELSALLDKLVLREPIATGLLHSNTLEELRSQIDLYDDQLLELLEQRMCVVESIGRFKKENNITIFQSSRWEELMKKVEKTGAGKGLSSEFIRSLFRAVHQESINHQNSIMNF